MNYLFIRKDRKQKQAPHWEPPDTKESLLLPDPCCLPEHLEVCAWEESVLEHDSPEEWFGKACVQAADIGVFIPRGHPHWRACSWEGNLKTSPPLPHPFGAFFAKAAAYPSLQMVGLSWPLLALTGTSERMNWLQSLRSQSEIVAQNPC